jgi:OOP family OmpA-OmpF porin
MKKNVLAALVVVGLLSSAAAHAENTYFSVGAGRSEYKMDGESENKTAMSLALGQSLGENFGYEIGYLNFGEVSEQGEDSGVPYTAKFRAQSVYAAAVGTLPVSESFSLFGKLGVSANYVKGSATASDGITTVTDSESDTKLGPMLGLGLAYNFTKQIAATLEYRYFHELTDGDLKASALTAGIRYHF